MPDTPDELQMGQHVELTSEVQLQVLPEQRRLGLRLLPYNQVAVHPRYGAIMFEPGAFFTDPTTLKVNPADVRIRMDHADPPTGLGVDYQEQPDAPYMEFQLSKTPRADEQLTLALDKVSRGASVGFDEVVGRAKMRRVDGQNVKVYGPASARLNEVSTTWQPTFQDAGITYMLSAPAPQEESVAETQEPLTQLTPVIQAAPVDYERMAESIATALSRGSSDAKRMDDLLEKFDQMVELQRASFKVPGQENPRKPKLEDWVGITLRRLAGVQISHTELVQLALDDVVTTEQPGLVPNVLVPDYDDVIVRDRPFLNSTRQVRPPATGTSLILPLLTTRAVAGTQAGNAEKGALTTTAPKVGTGTFAYKPVFGGADISIQMILRSDQSFMDLLTAELGEAYALDCEIKAVAALLAGYTDSASTAHHIVDGGVLDPEDPHFGEAWETSILASKRAPDHIWLSAGGVRAFIDAKSPMTNAPLYSNLAAAFTAGGGAGGVLSGLIPVYVPALDAENVDAIVGPARGFVWAEDPALRLEADIPSVAGRDIGLVGGIFPAPRLADAFTKYTVAS